MVKVTAMDHLILLIALSVVGIALGAPSVINDGETGILERKAETVSLNGRIIGGIRAPDKSYPYMASLRRVNGGHFCGGSIVNNQWVLTAAHCIAHKNAGDIVVRVGSNSLHHGGTYIPVAQLIPHSNFHDDVFKSDIGLVRVNGWIDYNDYVQPIALPPYNLNDANHQCTVSGWGALAANGNAPDDLQYLNTRIYDQNACRAMDSRITDGHICTLLGPEFSNCNGDSGSPLFADGYQIGIVSFGYGCGSGQPDVYTRVFTYVDWIRSHTG